MNKRLRVRIKILAAFRVASSQHVSSMSNDVLYPVPGTGNFGGPHECA